MVLKLKHPDVILSSRQKDGLDRAADPSPFNPLMTQRETTQQLLNLADNFGALGYKLRYKSESQVYLDKGFTWDHTQETVIQMDATIVIDLSVSGKNGLDTGSELPNAWYNVFVILDPVTTEVAGLFSRSTTPTLPPGFTKYKYVGVIRNAWGAIRQFLQEGFGSDRKYYLEDKSTNLLVVAGANNTTYRDLYVGDHIPRSALVGYLGLMVEGGAVPEVGMIRPFRRPYDFYRQVLPNTQIYTDCIFGDHGLLEYRVTSALLRIYILAAGFSEVI
jgi:hypothetical protein